MDYISQLSNAAVSIFNRENLIHVGIALLIFLIFWLLRKVFTRYVFTWLSKLTNRTASELDDKLLLAFEKPIRTLFIILGLYLALLYLPLSPALNAFLSKVFRSLLVILIAWGFHNLCGRDSLLSKELQEKLNMDSMLIHFFSNTIRFIIIALAIVIIAQEWDYDVNGFIAGLGLGGLALAMAAKDAIANIFGGIVIIMEKPFIIGDWIEVPGAEGVVENISFRSTQIRSFSQALITIPNSILADAAIINHTRMGKRRISFYLGLTRNTPKTKIEKCVERIKQMLAEHPGIHPETILVYFEVFNESSLDIFVYCFTNSTIWSEHLEVKEDINFKIMGILENEDVSLAFPSRSIYMENIKPMKAT